MYKLIVVDDETKIRNGICNYFPWNEIGFEIVAEAKNGRQALDYILKHDVDVVLSDIKMPVMTGVELAQELHSRKSKTKIVFLTGYKEFDYAQKALVYGVKSYIIKPTKYEELLEIFSRIKDELDDEQSREALLQGQAVTAAPLVEEVAEENTEELGYHEKKIAAIKSYVLEHYKDVTLEEVAGLFHMNLYYLSKYFKKWSGQNFSDYVISVKMEKAAEMLKDITYKTYEIGSFIGYDNAKNFSRAFKLYYGKSPREFRDSPPVSE
ncbi:MULTISPECIES: response regulator transcription factor [Paenibacillus]|uniref:Response regulator n=1 Tax=Paenibacillus radicis (ex Xue et al. 2023) TaxID=2972489 RepID=A0ABT1YPG3_9BACL|nr:response regulator [Paenibacillus radicis (ex Xue et al. 2023)]MCR8635062.1 response regulator [Paenibacillus radicis (ex Xue et al. 2023)]